MRTGIACHRLADIHICAAELADTTSRLVAIILMKKYLSLSLSAFVSALSYFALTSSSSSPSSPSAVLLLVLYYHHQQYS